MSNQPIWLGLRRGIARRCPVCGEGRLFSGFLTVRPQCSACGADNTIYPADDMPPYLTIMLVGHLIVPLFIWSDAVLVPPLWIQFTIWLPLTAAACGLLLQPVKGAVVGACWALSLHRETPAS